MIRCLLHIITLLLLVANTAFAQQPFSRDIWLNESNMPVKVNCLTQDSSGYIWLGTDDGLYRYNGRTFTKIETNTTQSVTALAIYDNMLVVGFGKGALGLWDGDVFTLKDLNGDIPRETISSIYTEGAGIYILSTLGDGLYMVMNNYCINYTMKDGLSDNYIYTIITPASRLMLAATDQGINQLSWQDDQLHIADYTTADGLPDNIVKALVPMKEWGWSWVGTHQGGLAFYCSKTKEVWTPAADKDWEWGQVNDILSLPGATAWVATEKGYLLNVSLDDTGGYIITPYYYPGQKLYDLMMDKAGNIWCGTDAGLKELPAEYTYSINVPAPYSLQDLTAIVCDDDNNIWFAVKNKLYCFMLGTDPMPKQVYTSATTITKLYTDDDGVVWVGTFGDGLWYSADHRTFHKVKNIAPLSKESILDIAGTADKLWVSGLNGVEELSYTGKTTLQLDMLHNKNTGIGSDYVYMIYPDREGRVWMATDGAGVCSYKEGIYRHWDSAAGMTAKVSYSITQDTEGRIWASTFDKGMLVFDGQRWDCYNTADGLQSTKVTAATAGNNGTVVISHNKGVDEYHAATGQFRHYGRRQAIGLDSVSGTLNLSAVDTSGCVYVPYQDGLMCFGKYNYTVDITPSVAITSINTFFRKTQHDKNTFSHSENHITFKFDGINYANPEQLYYRYKLEGYNEEWIPTRDEAVTFPQLPSGDYKFVVQASMSEEFRNYGTVVRSFTIDKPFWQELWFILFIIALVWMVSYTYIRVRERSLRKLAQLQKERMIFEYENLKSQVNPHFLFNSLNTLTELIEDDTKGAQKYTRQLSDLYRNMLSHKDKDLITLSEEWDIMENYLYVQKSRFGNALQMVVEIPDKIKKTKRVVPMALQLLLENAMKHNIVSQSKPLTIKFSVKEDVLVISNTYQPKMSKEKGAGLGLINIRKRYSLHTKREVSWHQTDKEFIVEIPLI